VPWLFGRCWWEGAFFRGKGRCGSGRIASRVGDSCAFAPEAAGGFSLGRWRSHRKNRPGKRTRAACGGASCVGNRARKREGRAAHFRNVSASGFGKRRLAGFGFAGPGRGARVRTLGAGGCRSAVSAVCWTGPGLVGYAGWGRAYGSSGEGAGLQRAFEAQRHGGHAHGHSPGGVLRAAAGEPRQAAPGFAAGFWHRHRFCRGGAGSAPRGPHRALAASGKSPASARIRA
jgi:hypothetical protein